MRRLLFIALLGLTACANAPHGIGTGNSDAPKEIVKFGVIESVTPILLDNSSNAGGNAGSIFGQVGGANTGAGRGAVVGSVLGTVLGGTLGQQAGIATKPGLEIWVRLNKEADEEGKSIYVMQAGKADAFKIGDPVKVIRKQGNVRIELDKKAPAP